MKKSALGVIAPVILLSAWEYVSRSGIINPLFFPAPTRIIAVGWGRLLDGTLLTETFSTLSRLLVGFAIGSITGYISGIALGLNQVLRSLFEPMLSALYTIPKIVLLPIFLLIFGFGDPPKIALIAVTVFFYVWVNTLGAVINIPADYISVARTITSNEFSIFKNVIFPACMPSVFTGLRIGIAVATLITISSEFLVGDSGLGYLIFNSRLLLRYEEAYVGIVVVALLGYLLQSIVQYIGKKSLPWAVVSQSQSARIAG